MNHSDKAEFKTLFDGVSEYYQKPMLSKIALQIYFGALDRFTIEDVTLAASAHLQDAESGKFYPKAADLIKHMEGGEITAEYIVAAAQLANSPLGIIARIHIGSWDLNNLNSFDLKQRAAECLQLLPEWKEAALDGRYNDHAISMMIKHGVSPIAPFAMGIAGPRNVPELISRANSVMGTDRHKQLLEDPHKPGCTDHVEISKKMVELLESKVKGKLGFRNK